MLNDFQFLVYMSSDISCSVVITSNSSRAKNGIANEDSSARQVASVSNIVIPCAFARELNNSRCKSVASYHDSRAAFQLFDKGKGNREIC
jgi:hypothetical protein